MNLIEQLGGYEKASEDFKKLHLNLKEQQKSNKVFMDAFDALKTELLEYRREHNIFEVGDKVVYVDDFMPDSVSVVSEVNDRVWLNGNNAVCIKEIIKHAEDAEIKAGKRLEVE